MGKANIVKNPEHKSGQPPLPKSAKGEGTHHGPVGTLTANNKQACPTCGSPMTDRNMQGYAGGGVVAPQKTPVMGDESGYAQGGQVPPAPSDVVPAKLTPGEVVIPAPVVAFLGQKFFTDLIAHAQEEMSGGENEMAPGERGVNDENPFTTMANEDDVKPQGLGW